MSRKSDKILSSKDEIKEFLGNITDYMFKKYIERGLPARYEDRRWSAHTDNLDDFMKAYTRISMKVMPEEEQELPGSYIHGKSN
jgi:hypothetical protein